MKRVHFFCNRLPLLIERFYQICAFGIAALVKRQLQQLPQIDGFWGTQKRALFNNVDAIFLLILNEKSSFLLQHASIVNCKILSDLCVWNRRARETAVAAMCENALPKGGGQLWPHTVQCVYRVDNSYCSCPKPYKCIKHMWEGQVSNMRTHWTRPAPKKLRFFTSFLEVRRLVQRQL